MTASCLSLTRVRFSKTLSVWNLEKMADNQSRDPFGAARIAVSIHRMTVSTTSPTTTTLLGGITMTNFEYGFFCVLETH